VASSWPSVIPSRISAVYIKKLDDYRKLVSRKIKAKQTADLLTAINSYKLAEEEAANFYIRFDKAFIDLYPNFVEEFNQLLLPEKQIVLPATIVSRCADCSRQTC
jgi:hypothetical protein